MGALAGVAVGWLIASALSSGFGPEGTDPTLVSHQVLVAGIVFVLAIVSRRRRATRAQRRRAAVTAPRRRRSRRGPPPRARVTGTRVSTKGIRRTDFDPIRFTGSIEMVFRRSHAARMSRMSPPSGIASRWSCRTREAGGPDRGPGQVTEVWREEGRDYLTGMLSAIQTA